ncbi:MAG: tetratricopeptide repeat protein [Candidatus Eremiobacteraeota bacterium]|nr:tetratricopeptide repeat protein [Candidatus Eremiobacteraeota bacterium]
MSDENVATIQAAPAAAAGQTMGSQQVKPYIIKTYDRWIILVLVLVVGWLLFRPLFAFAVYYRGVSFEHMLALRPAEHYYRKSISVDRHIPEGWLGLGTLQAMRAPTSPADYKDAVETFTRGIENNQKSGALPWALCRVYYEVGKDYSDALNACQRAFANDPANMFAWDYAAWASLHLGHRDQALGYWREALQRGHTRAADFVKQYSPK